MDGIEWCQVPVGLDASRWVTRTGCKTVLVVVHSVTTGQRLERILPLFETDSRLQVVFTAAPEVFTGGVARFLRKADGVVLPWEQATRLTFDLALAAGYEGVHELHAPLIVLPHGAGHNKLVLAGPSGGGPSGATVRGAYGLDRQNLLRDGRVVPAGIALSHRDDLAVLGRQCPEALPAAEVVGDPCYDQILVSRARRTAYRRALRVPPATKLVVTASTWGATSLFGQTVDLHDRMLAELPRSQYRVVALAHPNVWYGHGPRQVRAWRSSAMRRGLALVPPEAEWLGAILAADVVIGDAGSSTVYAAAAGVPVVLGTFPDQDVAAGSSAAVLAGAAPRLVPDAPVGGQLAAAMTHHTAELARLVAGRLTSEPGRFDRNMRRLIYRSLRLSQPAGVPAPPPAALPAMISREA